MEINLTSVSVMSEVKIRLTHCGPVMPYDDEDLGQHWLRQWLVAWWHPAITRNNDLSYQMFDGIDLRTISQEVFMNLIRYLWLKITLL